MHDYYGAKKDEIEHGKNGKMLCSQMNLLFPFLKIKMLLRFGEQHENK